MKKKFARMTICLLCLALLAACSGKSTVTGGSSAAASENSGTVSPASTAQTTTSDSKTSDSHKTAKEDAAMQTEDKTMPTRVLTGGTKIRMHFGDTVITGMLNDSDTAQALIAKLPVTVSMNRYSHDFCGSASKLDLPYQNDEVHYGWLNGDIDYAIDAPWFTVLFEDEDVSEQYGYQVNIGVMTCPLSDISALNGSYDVLIELDNSAS